MAKLKFTPTEMTLDDIDFIMTSLKFTAMKFDSYKFQTYEERRKNIEKLDHANNAMRTLRDAIRGQ